MNPPCSLNSLQPLCLLIPGEDLEWADGLHPWRCLIEAEADWINWKTTREVILSGPCPFEGWHRNSARQIAACFNQPLALDYAWAVTPKIGKKSERPSQSPRGFTTLCGGNNCFPFPSGWSSSTPWYPKCFIWKDMHLILKVFLSFSFKCNFLL